MGFLLEEKRKKKYISELSKKKKITHGLSKKEEKDTQSGDLMNKLSFIFSFLDQ